VIENDTFIGIGDFRDIKKNLAISAGLGVAFILLGMWNSLFIPGTPKAGVGWFATEMAELSMWQQGVMVVINAPIIETAFFCFAVFGTISYLLKHYHLIENQLVRIAVAILTTSLLFALFHFLAYGTALETAYVAAFLFNTLACVGMVYRNSQLIPTVLHAVVNGAIWWGIFVVV